MDSEEKRSIHIFKKEKDPIIIESFPLGACMP